MKWSNNVRKRNESLTSDKLALLLRIVTLSHEAAQMAQELGEADTSYTEEGALSDLEYTMSVYFSSKNRKPVLALIRENKDLVAEKQALLLKLIRLNHKVAEMALKHGKAEWLMRLNREEDDLNLKYLCCLRFHI